MSLDDDMSEDAPDVTAVLVYVDTPPGLNHVFGVLGRFVFAMLKSPDWTGPDPVVGDVVEVARDTGGAYMGVKVIGHRDEEPSLTSSYLDLPLEYGQADARFQDVPSIAYTSQLARPATWVVSGDGDSSRVAYGRRGATVVRSYVYWGRSLSWWRISFGTVSRPPYKYLPVLPRRPGAAPLLLTLMDSFEPGDVGSPVAGLPSISLTPVYRGPNVLTTFTLPDSWRDAMADGKGGCIQFEPESTQQGLTTISIGEHGSLAIH